MIPPLSKPPIPEPLWDTVPPQAQAALLALLNSLYQRIAELERRLNQNSTNSSKPPSSDPIGLKRKPPAPPSGRSRGAQPGHPKAFRTLVPPEKLRSCRDCKPRSCRRCGHDLHGEDPTPLIHQVADLPKIEPVVDQYRLHRLTCPDCGVTTCGTLPDGVPTRSFGPSLQAVLATLAGAYRLSKRQIQQLAADLFGLSISTGMISKLEQQSARALAAPYQELADAVHQAEVVNIDETGWRENRRKAWLWVTVTAMATVFTIAASRSGQVARTVLGDKEDQVVGSDRFSVYNWIWAFWRQICWSHLRRDFQAMIDRGGEAGVIGRRLMRLVGPGFRFLAPGAGRHPGVRLHAGIDSPAPTRGSPCVGGRNGVPVRHDGGNLRGDPPSRRRSLELRVVPRRGADEQCGGARRASRGDLASDQRGNR